MKTSLFDDARERVGIEELAGRHTTLRGTGREKRGACPLCGAGEKSARSPFRVRPLHGDFQCFVCEARGDVVDLEQAINGGTNVEAAKRLVGEDWKAQPARARPERAKAEPQGPTNSDRVAEELWALSCRIEGTAAETYLIRRGIAPEIVALAAERLRFHPNAKWVWDEGRRDWVRAPAMLAQVETEAGPCGGVHATYLRRDGSGKAALEPAKRMWGRHVGADGRPGGAWLIGPDAPAGADLVTGEGIETVLSLATLAHRRGTAMRACAALSLGRLQGGVIRDAEGCIPDHDRIEADPERPPFTWPSPEIGGWRRVYIGVDHDMKPLKSKGRTGRGKVCFFELGPTARARLCARLATAAWRRIGADARALIPPLGTDFNNVLRKAQP